MPNDPSIRSSRPLRGRALRVRAQVRGFHIVAEPIALPAPGAAVSGALRIRGLVSRADVHGLLRHGPVEQARALRPRR